MYDASSPTRQSSITTVRPATPNASSASIERTAAAGRSIALLNFGNPYVMADLPKPAFSLCTFSDATDSITAAVEVLFGELKPQGQLPVRISARYPFGYGLKA